MIYLPEKTLLMMNISGILEIFLPSSPLEKSHCFLECDVMDVESPQRMEICRVELEVKKLQKWSSWRLCRMNSWELEAKREAERGRLKKIADQKRLQNEEEKKLMIEDMWVLLNRLIMFSNSHEMLPKFSQN